MIKDNQNFNESIKPNSDFLTELKEKLPEFFNGEFEFDLPKFKSLLKENNIYDELTNGNQLKFIGKEYARKQVGERPITVVVPDIEHNETSENKNSQNLFFTGDNLEVLRHMQNYYQNSIDMIYIDPPYNTGNDDFIYPDNFEYNDEKLQNMFGLNDEELERLKSIQGKATHSAWLTFMYPRLYLAKKLLKPEGVIFVSIDENEQANLKILMDEIFGEINYIGDIIRKTKSMTNDTNNGFNLQHEYLIIYSKNQTKALLQGEDKNFTKYKNPDNDSNGEWISGDPSAKSGSASTYFKIINPHTKKEDYPPKGRYWAFSESTLKKYVKEGKIKFKENYKDNERGFIFKRYKKDLQTKNSPVDSLYGISNEFMNQAATKQLSSLFDGDYFLYPKPVSFIKKIIKYSTNKDSVVFDFFAGSSTTAEAVLQLNAEDGGNRRFIMATLPEQTYKIKDGEKVPTKGGKKAFEAGYMNIAELSRERIKIASQKIHKDTLLDLFDNFDGGFKHYMVVESKELDLDLTDDFKSAKESLFDNMINPFSSDSLGVVGSASGVDTILTTWLLADGYSLDAKIEKKDFAGYSADFVEDTRLYLIKGDGWGAEQTRELLNQIGKNQFSLQTIVYYKYHFDMETVNELQLGLSQLDKNIKLLGRF